jgi:hypothetical protein
VASGVVNDGNVEPNTKTPLVSVRSRNDLTKTSHRTVMRSTLSTPVRRPSPRTNSSSVLSLFTVFRCQGDGSRREEVMETQGSARS